MIAVAPETADPVTLREVEVDHAFLRQLCDWLERGHEASVILVLLDDLRSYLEVHFASEERPGALLDLLADADKLAAATALRQEHTAILKRVDRLRATTTPGIAAAAETVAAVRGLVRAIRSHEATETALLQDTLAPPDSQGGD